VAILVQIQEGKKTRSPITTRSRNIQEPLVFLSLRNFRFPAPPNILSRSWKDILLDLSLCSPPPLVLVLMSTAEENSGIGGEVGGVEESGEVRNEVGTLEVSTGDAKRPRGDCDSLGLVVMVGEEVRSLVEGLGSGLDVDEVKEKGDEGGDDEGELGEDGLECASTLGNSDDEGPMWCEGDERSVTSELRR